MEKRYVDIVVISDVHLGTYGCHARELLHYLQQLEIGTLILNGDFVDMWQFKKRFFPTEHMQVIHEILRFSLTGTKVYYITGNHDDRLRDFSDFTAGAFHLRDKLEIRLKGKRYWIFHGDIFDASVMYSPWLAKLGALSYEWLILLNRFINKIRRRLGYSRLSIAGKIKSSVKKAVKYVSDFEQTALRTAIEQGFDYVICGHIHKPQVRTVETSRGKVTYLNSGDWVENLTALEYQQGEWTLFEYQDKFPDHFRRPAEKSARRL